MPKKKNSSHQHVASSYAEIMQMKWLWNGHLNRLGPEHTFANRLPGPTSRTNLKGSDV